MDLVTAFEAMDDETAIKHFEARHAEDLSGMRFREEPDRKGKPRRLRGGKVPWQLFHARLHRQGAEHEHVEG